MGFAYYSINRHSCKYLQKYRPLFEYSKKYFENYSKQVYLLYEENVVQITIENIEKIEKTYQLKVLIFVAYCS